jgi:hypothetical protein
MKHIIIDILKSLIIIGIMFGSLIYWVYVNP